MSRFQDDTSDDPLAWGRWAAREKAVLNGKPGQASLAQLEQALLELPDKQLGSGLLCDGEVVCAIGALGYRHLREQGMSRREAWAKLERCSDTDDDTEGATIKFAVKQLGWTETLAILVSQANDDLNFFETPKQRYARMLRWVRMHGKKRVQ